MAARRFVIWVEVGWNEAREFSIQFGSTRLGCCSIESTVAIAIDRAGQSMSAVKQEGSDREEQNFEHHAVFKSRYREKIWIRDEQVSSNCPC